MMIKDLKDLIKDAKDHEVIKVYDRRHESYVKYFDIKIEPPSRKYFTCGECKALREIVFTDTKDKRHVCESYNRIMSPNDSTCEYFEHIDPEVDYDIYDPNDDYDW